jgi:hypothetical protein
VARQDVTKLRQDLVGTDLVRLFATAVANAAD